MLTGMRNAANNWLGRIVLIIIFGVLIVSFAVWGIGDIFRGHGQQTVATVGRTEIGVEAYRRAFQQRVFEIQQRLRSFTNEQARELGVDRQVLDRMVAEAALDQQARTLGLGLSEEEVARQLVNNPVFRGPNGRFDRQAFDAYLREAGQNEQGFLREQRLASIRQHLGEAIGGGMRTPQAVIEAAVRYRAEQRDVQWVTVPAAPAVSIELPEESVLAAFHERRKASFRAPEFRTFVTLALSPAEFAADVAITDQDLEAAYRAAVETGRLGQPERRQIQQIIFPDEASAQAAAARLGAGAASFEDIIAELRLAPADIDLGLKMRSELIDRAVADAAFALTAGQTSGAIRGQFGFVILRVGEIVAGNAPPLDQVRDALRAELVQRRLTTDRTVQEKVNTLHNRIEDIRASGKSLDQVSQELGRPLVTFESVDAQGRDPAGDPKTAILPDAADVTRAVFQSDIGVDNEAVRTRAGGYVWFEIRKIDPSRERTFAEVRGEVEGLWRREEATRLATERADELLRRINGGETLDAIAAELGGGLEVTEGITRSDAKALSASAGAIAFGLPLNTVSAASGTQPGDRILMRVTAIRVPPFEPEAPETVSVRNQLDELRRDEFITQYVQHVQASLGVRINARATEQVTGAAPR
jgi:peptidyl-prolyl cis-trans isomerase D